MKMLLAVLFLAGNAFAKDIPRSPLHYVYNEGAVSQQVEDRLYAKLATFEKKTGHQFVVAVLNSLEGENLEGYANRIFKAWRIGDKKRNDGVLFLISKGDRKWRTEVGYGLEGKLTDLESKRIVVNTAIPHLKAGDFDGGVEAAVDGLMTKIGELK